MPLIDIEKVLRSLHREKVEFVVIGGVATTLHGLPYNTYDLDICYCRSRENIESLVSTLAKWHPRLRGVPANLPFNFDVPTIRAGLNFSLSTDIGDLDIFGEVTGIGSYADVVKHSEVMKIFKMKCQTLSIQGLIKSKKAAGRKKDLSIIIQLEALAEMQKK